MSKIHSIFALFIAIFCFAGPAYAGDAATVVFKSGQVVQIADGFRDIINAMKELNRDSAEHRIVEMNIGGGTFLLNVAEVVVVCRDDCKSLQVKHQLDPARSKS